MSSPMFEPWLIPDTTRSIGSLTSFAVARITQSAGVPSTENAVTPSTGDAISCARTTDSRVMADPIRSRSGHGRARRR